MRRRRCCPSGLGDRDRERCRVRRCSNRPRFCCFVLIRSEPSERRLRLGRRRSLPLLREDGVDTLSELLDVVEDDDDVFRAR